MQSQLRDFLLQYLRELGAIRIEDSPRSALPNFVEGFVIVTNAEIGSEVVARGLQEFYVGAQIAIRSTYHWIERPSEPKLLVNITNHSKPVRKEGEIEFEITEHSESA